MEQPKAGGEAVKGPNMRYIIYFGFMQLLMMVFYFIFTDYDHNTDPAADPDHATGQDEVEQLYGMWQDIHVMIFIGFGFLMTFAQSYGFSSISLNFMTGAFAVQWGILTMSFFSHLGQDATKVHIHIEQLVEGDFSAAAALISVGAVLGKTTPCQTLTMVTIELIFYALNFRVAISELGVSDVGGSLAIHAFGAYFGLACSWVLTHDKIKDVKEHPLQTSQYRSDIFSMIGTLFLWCFWPSFVAVLAEGNSRNRAVIHTVLAIAASCLTAFIVSSLLRPHRKFCMEDIQNATLAGGVSIGAIADHYLLGGGAVLVGILAGALSTVGYVYVQSFLEESIGLYDTCGVHNLHGMTGVLGGLISIMTASMAGRELYGDNVADVFGEMGPGGRSATEQAGYQFLGLVVTLCIALGGGAFTGFIIKQGAIMDMPSEYFSDSAYFNVPIDFPAAEDKEDRRIDPEVSMAA